MGRARAGPLLTVSLLILPLLGFQGSHGQQLIKRLTLAEAQAHGQVDWHHGGLVVTTQSLENSVEEDTMGLRSIITRDLCFTKILLRHVMTDFTESKDAYLVQFIFQR